MDYVVDAHTAALVAQLPRTPSFASEVVQALDGLGRTQSIRVENNGAASVLRDSQLGVETYDFGFRDPSVQETKLPGALVVNPPSPWHGGAVSAHVNAAAVAVFLRSVLRRSNIDAKGGPMKSSVNCVVTAESADGRQWFNAFWNGDQMVYGQRRAGADLLSLAVNLDVVAHEMFHGVTDFTARLEYAEQSGALNESISDIFGVIISNGANTDPRTWDWEVGEGLSPNGEAFRDMKDPTRFQQPAHMDQYQVLPKTRKGDYGGVHVNSGIHNHAAYLMLTHADGNGQLTLMPQEVAAVFYIALTQHLSRTSQFRDSRRGALVSARSLFRKLDRDLQDAKVNAIATSFSAVGIED
jgi:bacillolysin/neutral peptidase B